MKTTAVHLAVYDTLADWETGHAIAHVNDPGFQRAPGRYAVRTVGLTREPVTTMGGVRITPDLALDEIEPDGSAMLVLPGAHGWETGANAPFAAAAARWIDAGVPVAAICGATGGLAAAGLLDDRDHTSNAAEFLAAIPGYAGADRFVDAPAVTGDGVITAGAMHPVAFAREVFAALDLYAPEVLEAWTGLYETGDPAWYGRLMAAAA